MKSLLLSAVVGAVFVLGGLVGGCTATHAALDKEGAAANLDNLEALVAENAAYTHADTTLPASLKETRMRRNAEALELAKNLAGPQR